MKSLSPLKRIHFIGIGGIGVSALARYFLSEGYKVSGSDANFSEITKQLKKEGAKIFIGHKASNIDDSLRLVISSAAITKDNPEIIKAKQLNIPVKLYCQELGELIKKHKAIAVSGAHGKSTTTSMLSLIFIEAGFDPAVIVGTKLREFKDSNFRKGKSGYLIAEADEYNASFLHYSPFAAIITNIDREHLDFYKNLSNVKKSFVEFINNVRPEGILVLNKDDKNLFSLKNKIQKIAKNKNIKLFWYGVKEGSSKSAVSKIRKSLKVPGEHNISNALAAYTMAKTLNVADKSIFDSLSKYNGAWRRMEYRGNIRNSDFKIPVYDDYAHHPTEIRATLAGIAQKWPKSAVICVFQPHQVKRLEALFNDFIGAFNEANVLVLLDVYKVKGREELSQNVNSEKLAETIKNRLKKQSHRLKNVVHLADSKNLLTKLKEIIKTDSKHSDYIVVMMGAGDIYKLTDSLIK
ncbi:MAG: UDP-N-acetylmuramate--L-alanine ligase [Patescibacteria group bacterium]